jgi:hypothetical protein
MLTQARLLMIAPLLSALLSAVLWVLLSGGAAHAALPDPTRPPAGLATAAPGALPMLRLAITSPVEGLAATARPVRPVLPVAPVPMPVPRVQALHHPADARIGSGSGSATALIDGRLVHTGDHVGDATVQEIRSDGVWLRLPRGGTQWLGLYALVELPTPAPQNTPEQNAPRKEP